MTRAAVNAWEMGINTPNAQSLIMLSQFFHVSVDYLLGVDDRVMLDISRLNEREQRAVSEMVSCLEALKRTED